MGAQWEEVTTPYLDTKVDNLERADGQIDATSSLTLEVDDAQLIANLNSKLEDALNYWNEPKGFDLKSNRAKNVKLYLGKQIDEAQLYRFQIPYVENEIFVAIETIVAYLTSQLPQPEVYPAQDTDASKVLAADQERGLRGHSQKMKLNKALESSIRNLLLKRVGILYLWFDPDYGENGEIRVSSLNPDDVVVDKNTRRGENPEWVCITRKDSIEQLIYRYPDKKAEILKEVGVSHQPDQTSPEIAWKQFYLTHYDDGEPLEACVSYFGSVILAKYRDPNWLYATKSKNFLDVPQKPFIFLNYINDDTHLIDMTTPVEQASWIQEVLNKRGRQIMENADAANGLLVISSDAMTMDDAENMTGDPNQKIVIDTGGAPVGDMVENIVGRELPSFVVEDKVDLRNTVHSIMGTPPQMRGDDSSDADTLGENLMVKNQATGRQDLIVRAVDSAMDDYFRFLTQMMVVHYTEKHYITVNSSDGDFDYITLHRDLIEKGMSITVKSGSTLPFDKSRQESVALNLAKMDMIDPLNLYKDLHMDSPQKRYDAWAKWKTDPMALARDALDQLDDTTAYIDWLEILSGKKVPGRDDASKEHVLIHRKQMISDQFLKAKKTIQNNFLVHVTQEVQSLELRTDLDAMAQQGAQALAPNVPIQPAPPPMPPGMPGQPQPPMPGQPMQPPMGQPPMMGQPPPQPAPPPPQGMLNGLSPQMSNPAQPPPML